MAVNVTYAWTNVVSSYGLNNLSTAGSQSDVAIGAYSNGRYISAWYDPASAGSIEGRTASQAGTAIQDESRVNAIDANMQFDPAVATGNNATLVTFTDLSADAHGDIRASLVGYSGGNLATIAVTSDTNVDFHSAAAALTNNTFVSTWTRQFQNGDSDINFQIIGVNGTLQGSVREAEGSNAIADHSSVAGLANSSDFVIAWEQTPAGGSGTSIYARHFHADGNPTGAAQLIDNTGTINGDVQVEALKDGGYALAYTDNGWGADGTEITLAFFNADGSSRSNYIQVNTSTAGNQNHPTLTTLENGYLVVGWSDGTAFHEQVFTPAGLRVGPDYVATDYVIEGEIAGLGGGLVANVRSSTVHDAGGDSSIRTSVDEFTRTTTGDAGDNVVTGDILRDTIFGGAGNDTLSGGEGDDTIVGASDIFAVEHNVIDGGNGNDTIYAAVGDQVFGGSGYDVLHAVNDFDWNFDMGATSIEYMDAGFGNDTITAATTFTYAQIYSGGGNDSVTGGQYSDVIFAGSGNDTVFGGDGNDVIVGGVGSDSLSGGNGDDRIYVDSADSFFDGGAGYDAAFVTGLVGDPGFFMDMGASHFEFVADFAGNSDTISGLSATEALTIYAGGGNDTVNGSFANDTIWGQAGNDALFGNSGNDVLVGGAGADKLVGGAGVDALYGNTGSGGDGAQDVFVFQPGSGTDIVFDFEHGTDKLDLTAYGTNFAALTLVANGAHESVYLGSTFIASIANDANQITPSDFLF